MHVRTGTTQSYMSYHASELLAINKLARTAFAVLPPTLRNYESYNLMWTTTDSSLIQIDEDRLFSLGHGLALQEI